MTAAATRALLAVAAIAAALALAACGTDAAPPASQSPDAGAGGAAVSLETPDLEISVYQGQETLGGDSAALSDALAHGKPVVLNFWAALCPPCRAEMPEFQRVHERRGGEVTILGVDIGPQQFLGTREEGRTLLRDLGVTYAAGTTYNETVAHDFEILGMPTTIFIRADGSVARKWSGVINEEKLNELVDELVGGASASSAAAGGGSDFV